METKISSNFKIIEILNMHSYKSAITKFGNKNCINKHVCFVYANLSMKICIDKADVFIDAIFISKFGNCRFIWVHV